MNDVSIILGIFRTFLMFLVETIYVIIAMEGLRVVIKVGLFLNDSKYWEVYYTNAHNHIYVFKLNLN